MKRKQLLTLFATTIGSSVAVLDGVIVNMALPKIAEDLHVGLSALQWITDGYMLSLSALILLGGSLGDIFGRKKVYMTGLLGFGVSSLLCAISVNIDMLIAMRIIQGIFGALMIPGALAIINTTFDSKERGAAIGRWTAWSSIAIVASPFLGGGILNVASWRWIFLINLPLIAVCMLLAAISVKETKDSLPRRVDIMGAVLASLSLAGIVYGLIEGPARQWTLLTIFSLVVGVVLVGVFLLWEQKSRDPMVKFSLFRSRNFTGANVMTFLMYGALGGFTFALVLYLQTRLGYSPLQAGLSLLPISLCLMLFAGKIGRLAGKYGPRFFMTVGPLMTAAGMALLYFLKPGANFMLHVLPGILLFSAGMALLVAPLTITVMASVTEEDSGIASGINNAVSRMAGLIVVALLGLLGSSAVYHFSMALCTILAAASGIMSFLVIEKLPAKKLKRTGQ